MAVSAVAAPADDLTEYEKQRLAHVARNREYMARLGVLQLASEVGGGVADTKPKRKSPAVRVKREPVEGTRRSARVKNIAPEHDGAEIDALGDDEDATIASRSKRLRARDDRDDFASGPAGSNKRVWASEDAALAASRAWLEDARHIMLSRVAAAADADATHTKNKAEWRDEAVRRWGDGVPAAGAVADWEAWTRSRIGTPPPPSDLQLLQEYYAHDAWQLLVACVLMSRVSSWATKHDTISAFFAAYPTPTAALAAEPDDALAILRPLGLFPNRFRSVVEVSTAVLTNVGPLDVGMEAGVNKIYGIGEFGVHSFEVFCRGDLDARPADKTLQAFVAWQKRQNADDAARK